MTTYTIKDATHSVQFDGELLAEVSTETDTAVRWTELELYRTYHGLYLLHRIGQSLVYHRPGTCNFGSKTSWDKVPEDAEPCSVCNPSVPEAPAEYEVWLEQPRHHVDRCATPEAVEEALLMKRPGKASTGSRFLSSPARKLLDLAGKNDDGIRGLSERVELL
jgi:hypothetical protein